MLITLIAIGSAHALYLTVLVWVKKRKGWSDVFLSAYLITLTLTFGTAFFAYRYEIEDLMIFQLNINLLLAPLFFVYLYSLTQAERRISWSLLLHFLPYLLTCVYWLLLFAVSTEDEINRLFSGADEALLPVHVKLALVLEALAIPVYVSCSLWLLRRHRVAISNAFSYTEGIDLKWARALVLSAGALWGGIALGEMIQGESEWFTNDRTVQFGYATASFFVFYLGFHGLKQGYLLDGKGDVDFSPSRALHTESETSWLKYQKSGLKEEKAEVYADALIRYVETEKPYLHSRLSMQDLAVASGIPPHHISQVINEHLGQTFYDFINGYRVEEFKRRLEKEAFKHHTLMSIALDCGFNSKSSFNRVFKKLEGCTPSQYQSRISRS